MRAGRAHLSSADAIFGRHTVVPDRPLDDVGQCRERAALAALLRSLPPRQRAVVIVRSNATCPSPKPARFWCLRGHREEPGRARSGAAARGGADYSYGET
jgi:hypothetical protein